MIAPSVAVICVLALWELVVGIGLLNEDHVPSMTATVSELAELLGDGDFWSAVGSNAPGVGARLGHRRRARHPARHPHRLEPDRLAVILMVISEMVASTNGIGFFVLQSQRSFDIPEMWSGILLLGILGYVLNVIFIMVERRVLAWHRGAHS